MRNTKYFIVAILLISSLSAGFAFTPHRIEPVDIRSEGMGGPYFTDSESFFTLFTNPAGLAFTGDKTLWPTLISVGAGGPLGEMVELSLDGHGVNGLTDLIGDSGFNFNVRTGPLTFGSIRNNFGWGVIQTAYAEGNVPSLTKSDISVGNDLGVVFGYAFPFDFGAAGKLSVGLSGRGIAQMEAAYTEGISSLIDGFTDVPMNLTLGFGFDIGVQYEVLNLIHVAVVWQDAYTATWTKGLDVFGEGGHNNHKKKSDFEYQQLESKLGIGVGVDIPLEKITNNVISHLGVYANYNNLWPLFKKDEVYRNPWLELSIGTELVLFDIVALRFGMREMYFSSGLGLYLGKFRMDFSIYGSELGLEPGYSPQLNVGMAMTVQY